MIIISAARQGRR